jgi:predicted peptidase
MKRKFCLLLSTLVYIIMVMPVNAQLQKKSAAKLIIKRQMQYLAWLPAGYRYDKHKNWPLLIFLHGKGERGTDLELVKKNGPPHFIEQQPDFPFILISPLCPEGEYWSIDVLDALLTHILKKYWIDEDRVYLTGLSMGGFGTWEFATKHPERFAAIAPVCGGGDTHRIEQLINVPVWAFHGAKDDVVPMERSIDMVEALNCAGGNARLTIFPEANHNSWDAAYANPELYKWFLSHTRIKTTSNPLK